MKEILSLLAVPVSGLITYILGHIVGRAKTAAEVKKIELDNLSEVVLFYKKTFSDLREELQTVSEKCKELSEEIEKLREENLSLKKNISTLNNQLLKYQKLLNEKN